MAKMPISHAGEAKKFILNTVLDSDQFQTAVDCSLSQGLSIQKIFE